MTASLALRLRVPAQADRIGRVIAEAAIVDLHFQLFVVAVDQIIAKALHQQFLFTGGIGFHGVWS